MSDMADYDESLGLRHGNDPGCSACGTCIDHDSCADSDNPIDFERGDCPECCACGDCISLCATTPAEETSP